jgi:hypothetical protein
LALRARVIAIPGFRWGLSIFVFALCCAADVFVTRPLWLRTDVAEGQFRRGYFERLGDEISLAVDGEVRPSTLPRFALTKNGELGIPPGMTLVGALAPGEQYELESDSALAPYVVIGAEAPVAPAASNLPPQPGEGRLVGGRTLSLQDGHLALVTWDATRPWREDAARLAALRASCAPDGERLALDAAGGRLEIRLGRCSLTEPLPSPPDAAPLLAVLAGPNWATVARRAGWMEERWIVWPLFAVVAVKELAMWWAFGLPSAAAVAAALAVAALRVPVDASITWPLTMIVAVVAAVVRTIVVLLRLLPRRSRLLAVLAVVAVVVGIRVLRTPKPYKFQSVMRARGDSEQPATCAVIGYSTVAGEALRGRPGGIRYLLDERCARCRDRTAALFAPGEPVATLRDAFCASPSWFGADGQVVFLGGANDDFLSALFTPMGALSMARVFIAPGIESWRHGYETAAAASLARIDQQVSALDGLMQCVHARRARFVFLHDFVVGDTIAGRPADRTAMLERRRAAVEAAGGTFIDLFDAFGAQAGVSWFNDSVHLSLVGHERVTDLACSQVP